MPQADSHAQVDADALRRGSEVFADCATFIGSVRSALDWSFSERGDTRLGSALAAVAGPLFLELSLINECFAWTPRALAALRLAGTSYTMVTTGYLKDLAEGLIALGRTAEAFDVPDHASVRINTNGERPRVPEVLRLRGEALAHVGSADAEPTLHAALQAARRQEAAAWEFRIAIRLCRLQRTRACANQGGDLLAAAYAGFQEGFDTADLRTPLNCSGQWAGHEPRPEACLVVPSRRSRSSTARRTARKHKRDPIVQCVSTTLSSRLS